MNHLEFVEIARYGVLTIGLTCALYQDVHFLKIKNNLNLTIAISGFILAGFSGSQVFISHVLGFVLPFVICIIFFAFRMLGAADIKLYMALGALMGIEWIIKCMIYSVLSGGVIALGVMFYRGIFVERIKYVWNYFKMLILLKKLLPYQDLNAQGKHFFPFAIAIICGSILACFL